MRKHLAQERASVVAAAAEKAGPLYVVASSSSEYVKPELASHKCTHCGTAFAAVKGMEPFCVTCGSDQVEPQEQQLQVDVPETDEAMCESVCASCGTHNQLSIDHAKSLAGLMHCSSCGSQLSFQLSDDGPVLLDHADADELEEASDADGGEDDPVRIDHSDAEEVTEIEATASEAQADDQDDFDPVEQVAEQQVIDLGDEEVDTEDVTTNSDPAQSFAVATIQTVPKGQLTLARVGESVVAFMRGAHVATLYDRNVDAEIALLSLSDLQSAVNAAVTADGLKKTLAAFNFELSTVSLPREKTVKAAVQASVQEQAAKLEQDASKLEARMKQSLSLAATAITKGLAGHRVNPIRASLVQTLENAGVQGAKRLVDTAFADFGDAYNRTVLSYAVELMAKSDEARNELATLVGSARPQIEEETAAVAELPFKAVKVENASVTQSSSSRMVGLRGSFGKH